MVRLADNDSIWKFEFAICSESGLPSENMSLFPFEYPDFTQVLPMQHHSCHSIILIRAMNISILFIFVLAVFHNKPSPPDLLVSLPCFSEVGKLLRKVNLIPGLFMSFFFSYCTFLSIKCLSFMQSILIFPCVKQDCLLEWFLESLPFSLPNFLPSLFIFFPFL